MMVDSHLHQLLWLAQKHHFDDGTKSLRQSTAMKSHACSLGEGAIS